jgi:predicted DCC family thiol-disulfide oxidoreductase YuxK
MSRPDTAPENAQAALWVVYDGECPFCSSFVRLYRLRDVAGSVHLIDARQPHPIVDNVRALGFDLDEGMVVLAAGRFYHGAEAMQILAILGSGSGLFNTLNRAIFRRPRLARALYPFLVRGRLATLRLLGRRTLHSAQGEA